MIRNIPLELLFLADLTQLITDHQTHRQSPSLLTQCLTSSPFTPRYRIQQPTHTPPVNPPRHHHRTEMAKTAIAYKEKMKEISVLSLICSCLYPETRKNIMGDFEDMDIKPINKRASGQAFEVILKPTSPVSDAAHCVTTPPKRDLSLDDIQKKLVAAEERRRSQEAQVLRALAEKRDHERDVLLKAMEENSNFSRMAEEKLQVKMEQNEENRQAYLAAIMERLQDRERHAQDVRRNKELKEEQTA